VTDGTADFVDEMREEHRRDRPPGHPRNRHRRERLSVVAADDEAGFQFLDGPRRREAAGGPNTSGRAGLLSV
jgi:hypothetical protein